MRREREKERENSTTKGRDIPTLRGGGFTYSADHKMTDCGGNAPTDCGGNSPSHRDSSGSRHSMKSGMQNRMSSGTQDSVYSESGMRSKMMNSTDSGKPERKRSGSPSDCR